MTFEMVLEMTLSNACLSFQIVHIRKHVPSLNFLTDIKYQETKREIAQNYLVFHAKQYQSSAHLRLFSTSSNPIKRKPKFSDFRKSLRWLGLTACTIFLMVDTSLISQENFHLKDRAIH